MKKKFLLSLISIILILTLLTSCTIFQKALDDSTKSSSESTKNNPIEKDDKTENKQSAPQSETKGMQNPEEERIQTSADEYITAPAGAKTRSGLNGEEYGKFQESPFYYASDLALSTFSIDVDTASYSNIRRMLNDGYLPEYDAVRVEEFINYFDYDYDVPKNNDPYLISVEMSECPWEKENYLVMIGLNSKVIDKREVKPSNLVFLIDVSG